MHSPDDTNVYGSIGGKFEGSGSMYVVEISETVFTVHIHLCGEFSGRMYRLATCAASQTDGQTDYRMMPIVDHNG